MPGRAVSPHADQGCALVTGASRGIGAASARALAQAGWPVVINYRSDEDGARAVVEAVEADGGTACAVAGDVSRSETPDELVRYATERFGPPLVLVNNAGVREDSLAVAMSDEAWAAVHEANLWGPFRLCRAVLPKMIRTRFGRIVSITSIAGMVRSPGQANYAASKSGIIGMTKTMAAEVARRGVTVNAVAPGFVSTGLTADVPDDVLKNVPLGRWGTPEEIAACVSFLASDGASFVTGSTLVADGGCTA